MVNYTRISVMSIGHYGGGENFGNTLHRKMSENTIIAKKGVERPQEGRAFILLCCYHSG